MSNVTALKPKRETRWLSPEQVCDVVPGVTVVNLQKLRNAGRGPRYYKPTPKTVVYAQADVESWVERSVVTTREQS